MLTVLLGAGLYVLMTIFNIVFWIAANHLDIDFGVEAGEWPILAILVATAIDTAFSSTALATGKYLLTRLTAVDRVSGGMRSILAILLLGLGLVVLRQTLHFVIVNLTQMLVPRFLNGSTATELLFAVIVAIDLGLMIVAVALGRLVLARESREAVQLRQ